VIRAEEGERNFGFLKIIFVSHSDDAEGVARAIKVQSLSLRLMPYDTKSLLKLSL
jgi:hypothetical protein